MIAFKSLFVCLMWLCVQSDAFAIINPSVIRPPTTTTAISTAARVPACRALQMASASRPVYTAPLRVAGKIASGGKELWRVTRPGFLIRHAPGWLSQLLRLITTYIEPILSVLIIALTPIAKWIFKRRIPIICVMNIAWILQAGISRGYGIGDLKRWMYLSAVYAFPTFYMCLFNSIDYDDNYDDSSIIRKDGLGIL